MVDHTMKRPINPMPRSDARVKPKRIERQAHSLNAQLRCVFHQDAEDGWMQVRVQMSIHMVQGQAGSLKLFELPMNLGAQLLLQSSFKEITKTGGSGTIRKL